MIVKAYVDSEWGQLHVRRNSPHELRCIAFHESPLNSAVFDGLLRHADGRLELIAVDTPGYGESDGPPARVRLEVYADTIWHSVAPLITDGSRPWLFGSHTGASIAIDIALRYQESVAGLVLSGTPIFSEERRWKYADGHTPDLTPQHDGSHLQRAWQRYVDKAEQRTSPTSLNFINWAACTIAINWQRYDDAYQAAFRYDILAAFARLRCPVILLTSENDPCADFDNTLAEMRPDVIRRTLPHVTGRPYWVAPDLFADEMLDLLMEARTA